MDKERIRHRALSLHPQRTDAVPGGRLSQPIKAVVFDIYGTLFISDSGESGTPISATRPQKELANLLRELDVNLSPEALTGKLHDAIRQSHRVSRQQGIDHPEVAIEKIWARILPFDDPEKIKEFAIQYELIVNPVAPMPGLESLLCACRDSNLPMGIVSNAQFYTPLLFEWFLDAGPETLGFLPDLIIYSFRMGMAKPALSLFEAARDALDKRGISSAAVVYMGNDMRNDIGPAMKIGFQTVLFAGDARSLRLREETPCCKGVTPDMVITHLDQLTDLLIHGSTILTVQDKERTRDG